MTWVYDEQCSEKKFRFCLGFLVGCCLAWMKGDQSSGCRIYCKCTLMCAWVSCVGLLWNPPFHVLPFGMTTCDNDALKLVQGSCYPWYSCFWAWCIWQCGVSSLGWWSQTCHRTMSPARCGVILAFVERVHDVYMVPNMIPDGMTLGLRCDVKLLNTVKKCSEAIPSLNDNMWEPKLNCHSASASFWELPFGLARLWQKRKLLAMTRVQVHVLPIGHQAWVLAAKFPTCWGATWKNPRA